MLHKQKEELLDCVESQVNQIGTLRKDLFHAKSRSSALEIQVQRFEQSEALQRESQASRQQVNRTQSNETPDDAAVQPTDPPQIISNSGSEQYQVQ